MDAHLYLMMKRRFLIMSKPKIVLIGAGSTIFGMNCIQDAFSTFSLWGSELVFVDLDENAVQRMGLAAEKMNAHFNAGFKN